MAHPEEDFSTRGRHVPLNERPELSSMCKFLLRRTKLLERGLLVEEQVCTASSFPSATGWQAA